MTIVGNNPDAVIGGVDTHVDTHVAAAVNHVGGVLGVDSFSTTRAGYRRLVSWLQSHGELSLVGVEGTGSYGVGLARYLTRAGIAVVEVDRPNRQVRHRQGTTRWMQWRRLEPPSLVKPPGHPRVGMAMWKRSGC